MKIACFVAEDWEKTAIEAAPFAEGNELLFFVGPLDHTRIPEEIAEVSVVSVFVDSVLDAAMLDRMPNLKLIATRSTGFDHIDLKVCQERGIAVANVPTYGSNTVAEHAFALLLTLSKRTFDGYEQVREGRGFNPHQLRGFDLANKTIGIVGTGNIGRHAARIAKGFGMNVVAFDVHPDEAFADELGFRYLPFDELLGVSDVISLHVPYLEATHHLINRENLAKIKPGAVLINTARGPVVETLALVEGLRKGVLAGAGLDVLEEEGAVHDEAAFLEQAHGNGEQLVTLLANHILIDHPNVIVTPHSAFNTQEALQRIIDTTISNIQAFSVGEPTNLIS